MKVRESSTFEYLMQPIFEAARSGMGDFSVISFGNEGATSRPGDSIRFSERRNVKYVMPADGIEILQTFKNAIFCGRIV